MKICIVGAGNAGCAHAFKLKEKGHFVVLLKTSDQIHNKNFEEICQSGGIWAKDDTNNGKNSFQKLDIITKNADIALANAELVMILVQSNQHERIAKLLSKHITNKTKVILIIPGNLGSLIFKHNLPNWNGILAEGESTPFDARIVSRGKINVLFKNVRNAVGFLPVSRQKEGMAVINNIIETYGFFRKNIIDSALNNPNLIVHTVGTIMSASRIEYSRGEFWMYKEAFTESIWNLIEVLDKEKNDVIECFGGSRISYLDSCKFRNEKDLSKNSLEVFQSYASSGGPKGPFTIYGRYLFEDVPNGLVTLSSLAHKMSINSTICDSLINIASSLVNEDFYKSGRSLENLKIDHLDKDELIKLINS